MVQWKAKSVARAPSLFSVKKSEENLTNEVLTAVAVNSAVLWDVKLIYDNNFTTGVEEEGGK